MQQTEKYQFNLIEGADDFSAEPLNQNMEKAEAVLTDLSLRVRLVSGTYTGAGGYGEDHPNVLEFPDAERPPTVILVGGGEASNPQVLIRGAKRSLLYRENFNNFYIDLIWTDKGVRWYSKDSSSHQLNYPNTVYYYAALI